MPYKDIPIAHVLNFWLADGFDASGETDVLAWLGDGKTLSDMLGDEASRSFYAERRAELAGFIAAFDLQELQFFLNNEDTKCAVVLGQNSDGELVFSAGDPAGTPAILTTWFKRDREKELR